MSTELTQSFIEMVKAYEAKPALEAEVSRLSEDNALCYQTIDLKNSIIASRDEELANLRAELAEVRKREEDASFRNLELDEKLAGIEKLLGVAERLEQARKLEHQATVDAMTPKPEPVQVVDSYPGFPIDPVVVEDQSEPPPTNTSMADAGGASETGSPSPKEPKINPYSGFPIHYPDGEYKGQAWYEKPSWVSWAAFVDAGGEPEPYVVR